MTRTAGRSAATATSGGTIALDSLVVLVVSVVAQLAAAATYLLVARAAGPLEFAQAITISSVVLSFVGVVEFGTSSHTTRELAAGQITRATAFHRLFSRVLVMAGVAAPLSLLAFLLQAITAAEAVVSMALVTSMCTSMGLLGIMRGLGRLRQPSLLSAADKIIGLGVVCLMTAVQDRPSAVTLLAALTVGPACVSAVALFVLVNSSTTRRPRWTHPYRGALGFGLTSSVTSVQTLDTAAISLLAGPLAAAQFGAVSRWVAPFNLIISSLTQVAMPRLAAAGTAAQAVRQLLSGAWLLVISWSAACFTVVFSPWIVDLLLGPAYSGSSAVLRIVALATVPSSISQVSLLILQARNAEKQGARLIVAAVVAQLAMVGLGSLWFGALGGAGAILLAQSLLAVLITSEVRALLRREKSDAPEPSHQIA